MTVIQRERPAAEAWVGPLPDIETAPDSIAELLSRARTEIAAGEKSLRKAAEYIVAAHAKGATQTAIAKELVKSQPWVARLLKWYRGGCIGEPFGRSHHRERERADYYPRNNQDLCEDDQARLKSAHAAAWKKDRKFLLDKFIEELNRRVAAEKRVRRLEEENLKRLMADMQSGTQRPAVKEKVLGSNDRKRLIKLLGMLRSNVEGEVANAARMADDLRDRLKLTWADLIVAAKDDAT
jgi:hypothetical protein